LDELSASSAAAAADGDDDGHMPGAHLLSSTKAMADAADGLQQQSSSLDMLLHLDQEFELQAEDLHASAAGDDSTGDDPSSSSAAGWGSSSGAGSSSRQLGSMQWPGGLAGGKVNVLGQLKSNRRAQMLPPSNKPLGKNVQIKPNLQVGLLQHVYRSYA
jgi:hypothetical protein